MEEQEPEVLRDAAGQVAYTYENLAWMTGLAVSTLRTYNSVAAANRERGEPEPGDLPAAETTVNRRKMAGARRIGSRSPGWLVGGPIEAWLCVHLISNMIADALENAGVPASRQGDVGRAIITWLLHGDNPAVYADSADLWPLPADQVEAVRGRLGGFLAETRTLGALEAFTQVINGSVERAREAREAEEQACTP